MKDKFSWTVKLSIIGILILMFNFFIIGGGHGYYEPLFISYPIPCLLSIIFDELNFFILSLIVLQFTIYGFILDNSRKKIKRTAIVLIVIHFVLGIIALQNIPSGFK